MRLGYERIIKDKMIDFVVEEGDEPWVVVKIQGCPDDIRINASDTTRNINTPAMHDEIDYIADAVHQAFIEANKAFFL